MTRIAFLGLGGVGGYFGAKLSRHTSTMLGMTRASEVEVIFLAREKTAEAIRANGIKLVTPDEEFTAHPHHIATDSQNAAPVDFLICAVKSYHLEESLQHFSGFIGKETVILPLLNGVDAEEKIRSMFPENEVWSGCVYIVSRITSPGVITETGNIHRLHFGSPVKQSAVGQSAVRKSKEKCDALYRIFKSAHEDVFLHENIRDVVWEKFIFISTLASLTSYLDICLGKILEHAGNCAQLSGLLDEITAVARAEKIVLAEDIVSVSLEKMRKLPYDTTSSMHSDFQKGNLTEYRSLTGHVVHLARKHGIATPHYDRILNGLLERTRLTGG